MSRTLSSPAGSKPFPHLFMGGERSDMPCMEEGRANRGSGLSGDGFGIGSSDFCGGDDDFNALDILANTRGRVEMDKVPTGEYIFLAWGYPSAVFFLLEFVALMLIGKEWCQWIVAAIPFVGFPLMIHFLRRDHARTHTMTREEKTILDLWIFIGAACCVGGYVMGTLELFERIYAFFACFLAGLGCFVSGLVLRFSPKTICGAAGSLLAFASLFFQGALWPFQMLVASVICLVCLVIPGHLYLRWVHSTTLNYQK